METSINDVSQEEKRNRSEIEKLMLERLNRIPEILEAYGNNECYTEDILNAINMENRTFLYWMLDKYYPGLQRQRRRKIDSERGTLKSKVERYIPLSIIMDEERQKRWINERSFERQLNRMIKKENMDAVLMTESRMLQMIEKIDIYNIYRKYHNSERKLPMTRMAKKYGYSYSTFSKGMDYMRNEAMRSQVFKTVSIYHKMYQEYDGLNDIEVARMFDVDEQYVKPICELMHHLWKKHKKKREVLFCEYINA